MRELVEAKDSDISSISFGYPPILVVDNDGLLVALSRLRRDAVCSASTTLKDRPVGTEACSPL